MSYNSLNCHTLNNNVRVFLSLLNCKIKQMPRGKMLHTDQHHAYCFPLNSNAVLWLLTMRTPPPPTCTLPTPTPKKNPHTFTHVHPRTHIHIRALWLIYYNITNLDFQWRILQKQQNYLTVVISFSTHNACTENHRTFLMVDQLPNTGVKYFPPVMKIINFQLQILYFGTRIYCRLGHTRFIPHLSLCHIVLHAK